MDVSADQIRAALDGNPTLALLKAYSRDWVIPLFAEYLERADGSVSAEWFHERVAEALEQKPQWKSEVSPSAHCRNWIESRWLATETVNGRLRYLLTEHSLRAIGFVRQIVEGDSSVSRARFVSISQAVRQLADMTNPNKAVQLKRIDAQMAELKKKREDLDAGRVRGATRSEMQQQLREVLAMTRSLPADFRKLKTMVEDRHQEVARHAMVDGPPKAELVEEYLRENDLLAQTSQGTAYRGFARMLVTEQARRLQTDIDEILAQEFAREHMTSEQREALETMLSTLLASELSVQDSYLRWSESLRRFLTRAAHGRHQHFVTLADRALHAGAAWVKANPGARSLRADILGVGPIKAVDASQMQLWRDHGSEEVVVTIIDQNTTLPESDREALRLAAGTSPRAIGDAVNGLLEDRTVVSGADVFESLPAEFRRLGAVVSILDLGVQQGRLLDERNEEVAIDTADGRILLVTLPSLEFISAVLSKEQS